MSSSRFVVLALCSAHTPSFSHPYMPRKARTHLGTPFFCGLHPGIFSPTSVHVSQYACQWTSSTHHNIIIPHLFVPITRIRFVAAFPSVHGRTYRLLADTAHRININTTHHFHSFGSLHTRLEREPTHVWYNTRKTDARGSSPSLPPTPQQTVCHDNIRLRSRPPQPIPHEVLMVSVNGSLRLL